MKNSSWELAPPENRITVKPSAEAVADKSIRALQDGDVALVLTRRKLDALILALDTAWSTQDELDILNDLRKLKNESL